MFDSLTDRLSGIFDRLTRRGNLSETEVGEALREVRVALLEADVALPVVRDLVGRVREKAVGQEVLRGVNPAQMVVKIVHDELVATLGSDESALTLGGEPPAVILMVGLQGSGKTTMSGKIGLHLTRKERKKVLLASLDVYRPAAQEQLRVLGEQTDVATLPIEEGQEPLVIASRAMDVARRGGYDVVVLDTAGRVTVDDQMMAEAAAVRDAVKPREILLVADAMTGQDAVSTAEAFNARLAVTGIALTRVDGDARGGAALSMRAVTGKPIKLIGVGERPEDLEAFHPDRVAGRILGMGDVVSLVERAAETIEQADAERMAKRLQAGKFDLNDLAKQLKQMRRMGGMGQVLKMLPGMGQMGKKLQQSKVDDSALARQEAILSSMTERERSRPDIIKASRKQRIASGSGTRVQDINKLLKQHQQMQQLMKRAQKMGKGGKGGLEELLGSGGLPH
ncbi:MAG: signal recognition particle protein [Alphaproteobacteria bacterium]